MQSVPMTCAIFHSKITKYQENKPAKEPKAKSTSGERQLTDFDVQLQTKLRMIGAIDANHEPVPVKTKLK